MSSLRNVLKTGTSGTCSEFKSYIILNMSGDGIRVRLLYKDFDCKRKHNFVLQMGSSEAMGLTKLNFTTIRHVIRSTPFIHFASGETDTSAALSKLAEAYKQLCASPLSIECDQNISGVSSEDQSRNENKKIGDVAVEVSQSLTCSSANGFDDGAKRQQQSTSEGRANIIRKTHIHQDRTWSRPWLVRK